MVVEAMPWSISVVMEKQAVAQHGLIIFNLYWLNVHPSRVTGAEVVDGNQNEVGGDYLLYTEMPVG